MRNKRFHPEKLFHVLKEKDGFSRRPSQKNRILRNISILALSVCLALFFYAHFQEQSSRTAAATKYQKLQEEKSVSSAASFPDLTDLAPLVKTSDTDRTEAADETAETSDSPSILPIYQALYEQNPDLIGWLRIPDTVIDYPVMQTPLDETYYLSRDFEKRDSTSGCLILDTASQAGIGTAAQDYRNGIAPSTNLIIHGHTMKSGEMFGGLKKYADETYGKAHRLLYFDSLYEQREYELIAVFYSQVYRSTDPVFKYYDFFRASTQEEFDNWYQNIKALSLYDTGVSAQFGDEFLTLSCCAYHVANGRFVVVARRVT